MHPGHAASDKPFSSARVILGEQTRRGGVAACRQRLVPRASETGLLIGMLSLERDGAVKVN